MAASAVRVRGSQPTHRWLSEVVGRVRRERRQLQLHQRTLCVRRLGASLRGCFSDDFVAGTAVLDQDFVGRLAHELHQFLAAGHIDRVGCVVRVRVAGAVPIQTVPAGPPIASAEFADGHVQDLGAVIARGPFVAAADGQLPTHVGLQLQGVDSHALGQQVEGAAHAVLEFRRVGEDASSVDDSSLPLAVRSLKPAIGTAAVELLPFTGSQFCCCFRNPLAVVGVTEVRSQTATAGIGGFFDDPFASAAVNT